MKLETRMTRQFIPQISLFLGDGTIVPEPEHTNTTSVELVPPDKSGTWRYREMQLIDQNSSGSSYTVFPNSSYLVPGEVTLAPSEVLVIWERAIQESKE